MKRNESFLFKIKKDQSGMAILMIVSAITLLTFLLADFTFETKLNKIKAHNYQDRIQARLCAESGLKLSLAKLKIYRKALNMRNKNKSLKDLIKPSDLERAVTFPPFVYPIPSNFKGINLLQKNAIADFMEESLLIGEVNVSISPIKGFLNPNNMRVMPKKSEDENSDRDDSDNDDSEKNKKPHLYIEAKLTETLTNILEEQKEKSDEFEALYGDLEANKLIKELKYYISDPTTFEDEEKGEFEALYTEKNATPKHAPLTSIEELYLLEGWPDDIVDLMKDKMTVHEASIIQVNEITEGQLKVLFPDITPEQSEEFFKHRDGDPEDNQEPQRFNTTKEFRQVLTEQLAIVDATTFDERIKEFESAGMKIGVAGKLFKIVSTGTYRRAKLKILAYVDLPIKPKPPKPKEDKGKNKRNPSKNDGQERTTRDRNNDNDKNQKNKKEETVEYLEPRIVEIGHG